MQWLLFLNKPNMVMYSSQKSAGISDSSRSFSSTAHISIFGDGGKLFWPTDEAFLVRSSPNFHSLLFLLSLRERRTFFPSSLKCYIEKSVGTLFRDSYTWPDYKRRPSDRSKKCRNRLSPSRVTRMDPLVASLTLRRVQLFMGRIAFDLDNVA